jgi:hypothetical protein
MTVTNKNYIKELRGRSLQANYTDWTIASCLRSYCQPLWVDGVAWSAQQISTAVNLGFLDQRRYFLIQVAPQLSSRGWMDSVTDLLLLRKSGRAGNRIQDLCTCSQKLWRLDHRGKKTTFLKLPWIRGMPATSFLIFFYFPSLIWKHMVQIFGIIITVSLYPRCSPCRHRRN